MNAMSAAARRAHVSFAVMRQQLPASFKRFSTGAAAAGSGGGLLAFAQANPFVTQLGVSTVKTGAADILTQTTVEGKGFWEIDWKRNMVFVLFGAAYLGGFQYWIQVNMFRKWFPGMDRFANSTMAQKLKDGPGMLSAAKQVCFDVFVHLPFMYFPVFYSVKESVQGSSWNPVDWVKDGCTKYYNNFAKDFQVMFTLWAPADVVLFSLPMWLRMPGRHMVSFGWTAYLSFLRGGAQKPSGTSRNGYLSPQNRDVWRVEAPKKD